MKKQCAQAILSLLMRAKRRKGSKETPTRNFTVESKITHKTELNREILNIKYTKRGYG